VALLRQATLADRLTLRRIRHRMGMVAASPLIRPLPSRLSSLTRRMSWDKAVAAPAAQVLPPRLDESLADGAGVLGLPELHQCPLQIAVTQLARHIHFLLREGVDVR